MLDHSVTAQDPLLQRLQGQKRQESYLCIGEEKFCGGCGGGYGGRKGGQWLLGFVLPPFPVFFVQCIFLANN